MPVPSDLCCACCFPGTMALNAAWLCCTFVSPPGHICWSLLLRTDLGTCPRPEAVFPPAYLQPPQLKLPGRSFPSCIKGQIPGCPGQTFNHRPLASFKR